MAPLIIIKISMWKMFTFGLVGKNWNKSSFVDTRQKKCTKCIHSKKYSFHWINTIEGIIKYRLEWRECIKHTNLPTLKSTIASHNLFIFMNEWMNEWMNGKSQTEKTHLLRASSRLSIYIIINPVNSSLQEASIKINDPC